VGIIHKPAIKAMTKTGDFCRFRFGRWVADLRFASEMRDGEKSNGRRDFLTEWTE
jgi:hypothetical protein